MEYKFQSRVMESLKSNLGAEDSVSRWLQETLEVEYSTARRKYTGDIKLSLEQFGRMVSRAPDLLSLALKDYLGANTFITTYNCFRNKQELAQYLRRLIQALEKGLKHRGRLLYVARDLPYFFFFADRTLAEFKLGIWSQQLKDQAPLKLDIGTYALCREAYRLYQLLPSQEIWHQQIWSNQFGLMDWYCQLKKLNTNYREKLYAALFEQGLRYKQWASAAAKNEAADFDLLFSDFITMNNGGLIQAKRMRLMMTALGSANFLTMKDEWLCTNYVQEFDLHLAYARSISGCNALERERCFEALADKQAAMP